MTDLFFVLEVDVYGHFFQKAKTKIARESTVLHYDQEFVIDLYGSQILRILCYEQVPKHNTPMFRGKTQIDLSSSWLKDKFTEKDLPILDVCEKKSFAFFFTIVNLHVRLCIIDGTHGTYFVMLFFY